MKTYTEGEEHILLTGLGAKQEKRVCADEKKKYAWLRLNPCIEYLEDAANVKVLKSSRDADAFLHDSFSVGASGQESVWLIMLDVANRPMGVHEAFVGGRSSTAVDIVAMFQPMILLNASGFIFAHNHPTEGAHPSDEDVALTNRIKKAAELVGLQLVDSMVLTRRKGSYFSFLDGGLLTQR